MTIKSVPSLNKVLGSALSRKQGGMLAVSLKASWVTNSDRIAKNPVVFLCLLCINRRYWSPQLSLHQHFSLTLEFIFQYDISIKKPTNGIFLVEIVDFSQHANLLFHFIFKNGKHDLSTSHFILASWTSKYILSFSRYFIIIIIFPQQKI